MDNWVLGWKIGLWAGQLCCGLDNWAIAIEIGAIFYLQSQNSGQSLNPIHLPVHWVLGWGVFPVRVKGLCHKSDQLLHFVQVYVWLEQEIHPPIRPVGLYTSFTTCREIYRKSRSYGLHYTQIRSHSLQYTESRSHGLHYTQIRSHSLQYTEPFPWFTLYTDPFP